MKATSLGEFEELVLLVVGALGQEAYGISIKDMIREKTSRNPSIGALHTALGRLEKKGFLKSRKEEATAERRGRRKRFYEITAAGKKALAQVYEIRASLIEQIPSIQLS